MTLTPSEMHAIFHRLGFRGPRFEFLWWQQQVSDWLMHLCSRWCIHAVHRLTALMDEKGLPPPRS